MDPVCDLVLPCRDEAAALGALLPRVPDRFSVIVVDNGSSDGTAEVARSLGARVVTEPVPGYGAAVHAGLLAAERDLVAVMDGDGSFDPADLLPLLADVRAGRADLAVGRRRPVRGGVWPWHARLGNALGRRLAAAPHRARRPRHRADAGVPPRRTMLDLDLRDRRFGYPVELLQKAPPAPAGGWSSATSTTTRGPRAPAPRCPAR